MKILNNTNQAGFTALAGVVVVVVVALIGVTAWRIHDKRHASTTTSSSISTTTATSATATGNASLKTDLNGITSSLSQENQANASAGTALNDQQNEITVPTN